MEISHAEVRRHPIWQREARGGHEVEGPHGAISPRGRFLLMTMLGAIVLAVALVAANG